MHRLNLIQEDVVLYGIDWDGPITDSDDADQVTLSEVRNPLADSDYEELRTAYLQMITVTVMG